MIMFRVTIKFTNDVPDQALSSCPLGWIDINLPIILTGPHFQSVTIEKDD